MRRVVHKGQTPRPLQAKATRKSCSHAAQRARGKTVGETAAGQVLAEVSLDVARDWFAIRIPGTRLVQPRFQMPLHHLIDHRAFRQGRLVH